MGFLDALKLTRLKEGLMKTRDDVVRKMARVLRAKRKIDETLLEEIEEILILGDVGVTATSRIVDNLRERVKKERYEDASELLGLLKHEVAALFGSSNSSVSGAVIEVPDGVKPYEIMIVGVNGVGKTSAIGRIANN